MTYRIRSYLQGGQPPDINDSWLRNEDGTIFETNNQDAAIKKAIQLNEEQKGRKGSQRLKYGIIEFDELRGVPKLGWGWSDN